MLAHPHRGENAILPGIGGYIASLLCLSYPWRCLPSRPQVSSLPVSVLSLLPLRLHFLHPKASHTPLQSALCLRLWFLFSTKTHRAFVRANTLKYLSLKPLPNTLHVKWVYFGQRSRSARAIQTVFCSQMTPSPPWWSCRAIYQLWLSMEHHE